MTEKDKILKLLGEVYDPEIPISIVDLGFIYEITIQENRVKVLMTLSSPVCPMSRLILRMVQEKLESAGYEAEIELTFDPLWTPERMSKEIREKFGFE